MTAIQGLTTDRLGDFKAYCRRRRDSLDDSYLSDYELKAFTPNEENPTVILTERGGSVVGAASLMIDAYQKKSRRARFRIFHAESGSEEDYRLMMEALLPHTEGLSKLVVFVPLMNAALKAGVEEAGFVVERYAFVLERAAARVNDATLPEGFTLKDYRAGRDETDWALVRNEGFAALRGAETPRTPEMIRESMERDLSVEGGAKLLYDGTEPAAVIIGSVDEDDSSVMEITTVAVRPAYQGKGLGQFMLRTIMKHGLDKGFRGFVLSVNGENERAKRLYTKEGFKETLEIACYSYPLND